MLVYLHIPFCHQICPYCSFYKHQPGGTDLGRFVEAVITEVRWRAARMKAEGTFEPIETLYLGGGTPSLLSRKHLRRLFEGLREVLDLRTVAEVTMEANPATFRKEKAALMVELGVTRVSLGVQSFAPHVLKTLGRDHSPAQAVEAFTLLKEAGMQAVNVDLMFSIPGQTLADWRETLEQLIALKPDHVSAYNLTYEEDTPFLEALSAGRLDECEDRNADHFLLADELLRKAGFSHYETSNYGQPGKESVHNRGYWEGLPYLGLGPSAVSTIGECRTRNVSDTAEYIKRVEAVGHALDEEERIDEEGQRLERIALLMRTAQGVPLKYFGAENERAMGVLIAEKLAEKTETHLRAIGRGKLLVDELATYLV